MSKPTHGNYKGYYSKRPFINDPRLKSLPEDLFRGKRVLDIGCNEGFVTCEVAQGYGARCVVGVDIDRELIQSAWKRRRAVWSLQSPPPTQPPPQPQAQPRSGDDNEPREKTIAGQKRKRVVGEEVLPTSRERQSQQHPATVMVTMTPATIPNYFPKSCPHSHGPLPIPPDHSEEDTTKFPHNVSFKCADWVKDGVVDDAEGYDVVLAFSISKWIHLNEGDDGLVAFFRRVYDVLREGGTFVLEPQPWSSYARARKMDEKLRQNAQNIKVLPDDFGKKLKEIGFESVVSIGVVGEGGFSRPIDLYRKPNST